jgi:hypothetical protein
MAAGEEFASWAAALQEAKSAGISWTLARTWPGGRTRERQLKTRGGASRRCPECGVKPRTPGRPAEGRHSHEKTEGPQRKTYTRDQAARVRGRDVGQRATARPYPALRTLAR